MLAVVSGYVDQKLNLIGGNVKVIKYVLWVLILSGFFLGHIFTVASLLLSILYIIYLRENRKSFIGSSDYWESLALYWHDCYTNLIESHPEAVRIAVESYQIEKLLKGK